MPEPHPLPWKVAAEKAAEELDMINSVTTCLPQKPQYFSGFKNYRTPWTIPKNVTK